MCIESRSRAILFDFVGVLLFPRPDYILDPQLDAINARMGQVTDDQVFQAAIQQQYQLSDAEYSWGAGCRYTDHSLAGCHRRLASFSGVVAQCR